MLYKIRQRSREYIESDSQIENAKNIRLIISKIIFGKII